MTFFLFSTFLLQLLFLLFYFLQLLLHSQQFHFYFYQKKVVTCAVEREKKIFFFGSLMSLYYLIGWDLLDRCWNWRVVEKWRWITDSMVKSMVDGCLRWRRRNIISHFSWLVSSLLSHSISRLVAKAYRVWLKISLTCHFYYPSFFFFLLLACFFAPQYFHFTLNIQQNFSFFASVSFNLSTICIYFI